MEESILPFQIFLNLNAGLIRLESSWALPICCMYTTITFYIAFHLLFYICSLCSLYVAECLAYWKHSVG